MWGKLTHTHSVDLVGIGLDTYFSSCFWLQPLVGSAPEFGPQPAGHASEPEQLDHSLHPACRPDAELCTKDGVYKTITKGTILGLYFFSSLNEKKKKGLGSYFDVANNSGISRIDI